MKLRSLLLATAGIAVGVTGMIESKAAFAAKEVFFPVMVYRTGAYAPSGVPIANGFRDYYDLLNKRDGGIEGNKVVWEECETKYNTKIGVECYEKLKGKHGGAVIVSPYSTGLTYQLIPKAPVDNVPILSMGYGRTAAADGRDIPLGVQLPKHLLEPGFGFRPIRWQPDRWLGQTQRAAYRPPPPQLGLWQRSQPDP